MNEKVESLLYTDICFSQIRRATSEFNKRNIKSRILKFGKIDVKEYDSYVPSYSRLIFDSDEKGNLNSVTGYIDVYTSKRVTNKYRRKLNIYSQNNNTQNINNKYQTFMWGSPAEGHDISHSFYDMPIWTIGIGYSLKEARSSLPLIWRNAGYTCREDCPCVISQSSISWSPLTPGIGKYLILIREEDESITDFYKKVLYLNHLYIFKEIERMIFYMTFTEGTSGRMHSIEDDEALHIHKLTKEQKEVLCQVRQSKIIKLR